MRRIAVRGLALLAGVLLLLAPAGVSAAHRGTPHPAPAVGTFEGCPPRGIGGDPNLNYLKNRVDEPATAESWTIHRVLDLPHPPGVGRRHRARWPATSTDIIVKYEGAPVRVTGYLIRQKKQGPESTNCGSSTYVDWHWWITVRRGQIQAQSVVAEPTPRVMVNHPKWRSAILRTNKRYDEGEEPRVRITGWLLFDQEHPEQLSEHRGTLWEIHPVTNIEIWTGSRWIDLDEEEP